MLRLFTFILLLTSLTLAAQPKRGATIEKRALYLRQHPEYHKKMDEIDHAVKRMNALRSTLKTTEDDPIIVIPVVFHVVYNTTQENVSDQQVLSQLDVLNEDFRRLNADKANTPAEYLSVAADTRIQFCLASLDPDGNPTTGIQRRATTKTRFSYIDDDMKFVATGGLDAWDTKKYLNIWVCDLGDILGYSQFPGMEAQTDGVVIHYEYFGRNGTAKAPFYLGRTCTHEVGHWLGLEHPWGNGSGGCEVDDDIEDTPVCKYDYESREDESCPSPGDQCGKGRRMIENYMDYSQDACFNLFTKGQTNRMRAVINTQRQSLLSSFGCGSFSDKPYVSFNADKTVVYQGGEVTFEGLVNNAASFTWQFEGTTVTSSSALNPKITYVDEGRHTVTLTASNPEGDSVYSKQAYIQVLKTTVETCLMGFFKGDNVLQQDILGYISGHNSFYDKAKANYFESPKPYVAVRGIKYLFGHVQYDDPSASITAVLWEDNNGKPGQELFSKEVVISSLTKDDTLTVLFDEPVEMLGPYFAGIKLNYELNEVEQNSVALYMTRDGLVTPGTAWEQLSNDDWHPFTEPDLSWGKNVSLAIFPILKMIPPEVSFEAEKTMLNANEPVRLNSSTKYAYSFDWDIENGWYVDHENLPSPTVYFEYEGLYDVKLTASNYLFSNELTKQDYIEVFTVIGGLKENSSFEVKVFPNPFRDQFTLQSEKRILEVRAYDLQGRMLFLEKINDSYAVLNLEYLKEQVFLLEVIGINQKNRILMYKH